MILWRPEFLPTSVIVVAAPPNFPRAHNLGKLDLASAQADHAGLDGKHIALANGHQLWLPSMGLDAPLGALVPFDDDFSLRMAGLFRFGQYLTGQRTSPLPRSMRLTSQRRDRLILMLRALDAHLAGATYREIAAALFGNEAAAEHGWKTSPVRARTIRLVQDAIAMMEGGYFNLLRGR
ncbi:DUF2285 domain-containing protein [Acidocella facilis]|uniref:DUF2285 domain-containing protein n=1 Tax=Acidocella facilis TaxID=525 RepID=UPI001F4003B8|nr:DUF2285 domain-containing protein [Acidocella facilis]